MMRIFDKSMNKVVAVVGLAIIGSVVGWMTLCDSADVKEAKKDAVAERKNLAKQVKKVKRLARRDRRAGVKSERVDEMRVRPSMELEDDIMKALSSIERQMLELLQSGLDHDDVKAVRQVAAMIQRPPDGRHMDEIPQILRQKVIEALGWFGVECLPELAGFLADVDEDTRQIAFDQFELALEDISLSDFERAKIVTQAASVLKDGDMLDRIFMELNDMRHTVGVSAIVDIFQNGTPEALEKMPEALAFFTGEDNITTVEDVEKWLEENPDGADDDDLYGGFKD